MTDQPEPIRKSQLPTTPPPEWEFSSVFGLPHGCVLAPTDAGDIVVRRLVTYGDWEPVRPARWADEPTATVRDAARQTGPCGCGQPATPDVVHRQNGPCYMDQAGGLQTVELPNLAARQTGQQPDETTDDLCAHCGETRRDHHHAFTSTAEFDATNPRRLNRPEQPDPTTADDPTPLRWGLGDVLHGDDDTTIVCLSGPDREPYWLELDPERAAAFRRDLTPPGNCPQCDDTGACNGGPCAHPAAGLDASQPATDRAAVLREAADAIDAETAALKADGVLEADKFRPCRDASQQLRRMAEEGR